DVIAVALAVGGIRTVRYRPSLAALIAFCCVRPLAAGALPLALPDGRIAPALSVSPTIFAPGRSAAVLACISNENAGARASLRPGDRFRVTVDAAAGTVALSDPLIVSSAVLS